MKTICFTKKDLESFEGEVENLVDAESLYVLSRGVGENYFSSSPVLSIAVGCGGSAYEGTIIRAFHKMRLGLNGEQLNIIGCDKREIEDCTKTQDYDLYFGGEKGDAKEHSIWLKGVNHFNSLYNFVFMNHPTVPNFDEWFQIYKRSLSFVDRKGVIATIVEGLEDRNYLRELSSILERDSMVESRMEYFCRTDGLLGPREITFLELRRGE